ncbi:hypothetical protein CEXT_68041 [Caerostris extrusa]|uniref:Uncharacterized protein n=1 Tax=Caerostris extrusa TaxID=172846 RepID=A0AAV4VT03_CAEEX|nr:hypothetical protein CEXT_68041 [Caerostris extrusa]
MISGCTSHSRDSWRCHFPISDRAGGSESIDFCDPDAFALQGKEGRDLGGLRSADDLKWFRVTAATASLK